jgi:hypothetical protein
VVPEKFAKEGRTWIPDVFSASEEAQRAERGREQERKVWPNPEKPSIVT